MKNNVRGACNAVTSPIASSLIMSSKQGIQLPSSGRQRSQHVYIVSSGQPGTRTYVDDKDGREGDVSKLANVFNEMGL